MTPEQLRMARAALRFGVRELAAKADVAVMSISRYENEHGGMQTGTRDRLQAALEAAGIVFLSADDIGPGIRVRKTD